MPYNPPVATWDATKAITVARLQQFSDMDYYFRDGRPDFFIQFNNGAAYTTTSASFVDLDSTHYTATVTVNGSRYMLGFSGAGNGNTAAQTLSLDFTIDGTRVGAGANGLIRVELTSTANLDSNMTAIAAVTLTPGSHTFRVQWRTNTGTGSMQAASGGGIPMFFGLEVG